MLRYETLFLAVPEITADEATTLESQFEKVLKEKKGNSLSFERWGKYKLAYPVRKNDYGVYYLARFEIEPENTQTILDGLRTLMAVKYNELVMRYMICALDAQGSLTYQRPESLEEAPARDVEAFLKENKMSGLLDKTSRYGASSKALTEEVDDSTGDDVL
ncbi:MAG TPA: 30S ribosomal protein S6 [Candidatus Babeliaceae bacterium]|nr:30S ribosomal protein S6 [Candidatus Babeliaceae bacterium]